MRQPAPPISEPAIKVWVGEVAATFSREDPSIAHLFIRAVNWGDLPVKVVRLSGQILLSHDNGEAKRVTTRLPSPSMNDPEYWDHLVEPGYLLTMDIVQSLPRSVSDLMPDLFRWSVRPRFDFDELQIVLEAPSGAQQQLKLCDSLRLTTGDWNVRYDQASKMFKTDAEAKKFREDMLAVAAIAGKLS